MQAAMSTVAGDQDDGVVDDVHEVGRRGQGCGEAAPQRDLFHLAGAVREHGPDAQRFIGRDDPSPGAELPQCIGARGGITGEQGGADALASAAVAAVCARQQMDGGVDHTPGTRIQVARRAADDAQGQ
jgi:hypothetical protein